MKLFTLKRLLVLGVLITAVVFLLPTFTNTWPHKQINLGLDLQGGMHLVLEVQNVKAVEAELERTVDELKKELRKDGITHLGITRQENNTILAELPDKNAKTAFEAIVSKEFSNLKVSASSSGEDATRFQLRLPDDEKETIRKMATEQALETIRNRIDEFGVSEPDIRIQGENRILLQLPGINDPERAKDLIGKTAQLTFQLVNDDVSAEAALQGSLPVGSQILYENKTDPVTGNIDKIPHVIKKQVLLDGSLLVDARVEFDQFQQPQVGIAFNRKGAHIFDRITGQNIKKRLAIVLDNTVYSAPVIQDRIAGGKAVITGNFTLEEAKDLAIALRAGSLPAPVTIIEERTVGPTLGADSIRMGMISMLAGGALVLLFMAIYYKGAGLIANLALVMNIILIGGGLAAFQANKQAPKQKQTTVNHNNKDVDIKTVLERINRSNQAKEIQDMLNGGMAGKDWSFSERDQSLCNYLAFYSNKDRYIIDQIIRNNPVYRQKWDNPHYSDGTTYGQETINKALQIKDEYDPNFDKSSVAKVENNLPFVRVDIDYYKVIKKPDAFGFMRKELKNWSKDELKQDYGKDAPFKIKKYDDFILHFDYKNHKEEIHKCYNLAQPMIHTPKKG
ncbi:MAG: protein translocase subunit SecD, partial [Desulfotignum sp.]